jgi:hypothetical protein
VATFFGPDARCDSPFLGGFVAEQLGTAEGGAPGALTALCTEPTNQGPPAALCDTACDTLAPCFPPEGDAAVLRDPDYCALYCLTDRTQAVAAWSCVDAVPAGDEATMCVSALGCLNGAGQPCPAFAARVGSCLVETCPGAAPAESALAGFMNGLCMGGTINAGSTGNVGPETDCAEPQVAFWVGYFGEDTAAEPNDGALATMCPDVGPANPVAVCSAACAQLAPCIPEGNPAEALRDPDLCNIACLGGVDTVGADTWACLADTDECGGVFACF